LDFFSPPALVKILATFAVMLFLGRFFPLYVGLLAGSAFIGVWMGIDAWNMPGLIWDAVVSSQARWLALMLALIVMFSDLLGKSGRHERIVSAFHRISPGPKFTLAALPALIGFLPMPGGAVFSAPMVAGVLAGNPAPAELKAGINYWFRHVVEFWWPLYPGVVLAVSLFHVDTWRLALAQSPLTVGAVLGGMLFLLRLVPLTGAAPARDTRASILDFFRETAPIVIAIAGMFAFQVIQALIRYQSGGGDMWPGSANFVFALLAAIIMVVVTGRISLPEVTASLVNRHVLYLLLIVAGIMSFKGILVESHAIDVLKDELAEYQIPPVVIIAVLAFVAGLVTGIALGFVGTAFPLAVSLLPEGASPYPYCLLAYGFGFVGMMLSPVHLCMLVNKEYFYSDLLGGYRYLWKPSLFCLFFTALVFCAYKSFFPVFGL